MYPYWVNSLTYLSIPLSNAATLSSFIESAMFFMGFLIEIILAYKLYGAGR